MERGALRLVRDATHEDRCRVARAGADGGRHLLDLGGKLARGRDNEHERALPMACVAKAVERGEQEGGRLAGARLRGGHDVGACENGRNRCRLDRRWGGVAHVAHGGEGAIGEAEVLEAGGEVLLGSDDGSGCGGAAALGHVVVLLTTRKRARD